MGLLNRAFHAIRLRPLIWDSLTTTFYGVIGKGLGFLVPFFIAAWFGVSSETDAFFFAYGIILFLSGIFAPVIESIIVPYIAECRAKGGDVGAFVGRILGVSALGIIGLSVIVLLVIRPLLSVITDFTEASRALIFRILLESIPLVILLVWTSILTGALNAYKRFAIPAVIPGLRAIINLLVIVLLKHTLGVHAIALGYVISELFRMLILLAVCPKSFSIRLTFRLNAQLVDFLRTASYQTFGMIAASFSSVVSKTLATWASEGAVSILEYAERLYMIPLSFMTMGLMVAILSHWSNQHYEKGSGHLGRSIKRTIRVVAVFAAAATIGLILLHQPLVKLAYGRGGLKSEYISEIGLVWVVFLLGLVPQIICSIYIRGHIVLRSVKIFIPISVGKLLIDAGIGFFLMRYFDVAGIAAAVTLSNVILLFVLKTGFDRKLKSLSQNSSSLVPR